VNAEPSGIGVNPDTNRIYIVDLSQSRLTVVDEKLE
jgi:DNA-binding beta-propeller fold protein YncE